MSRVEHIDDEYRSLRVNRELYRLLKGNELVGHVRRDLDQKWYAVLSPGSNNKAGAMQRLILAQEAMEEFLDAVNG